MLSEFCPDVCPWADIAVAFWCLRMGKIDVISYKYVIISIINGSNINIISQFSNVTLPNP